MIQCEDVNLLENANWKALFQAFNVLSAERVFLLTIADAVLDWRRQEKQNKEDTDLEQAVSRVIWLPPPTLISPLSKID